MGYDFLDRVRDWHGVDHGTRYDAGNNHGMLFHVNYCPQTGYIVKLTTSVSVANETTVVGIVEKEFSVTVTCMGGNVSTT